MNVYDKIFGKVKTGRRYNASSSTTARHSSTSLRSSMRKFRQFVYTGSAGKNLKRKDADLILSVIEPRLKRLPIGKKLSYSTKARMKSKLWQMVKKGKLSHEDYKDGKRIIDQF